MYVTVKQTQDILQVSRSTVVRMVKNNTIESIKCGRSVRILLSSILSQEEGDMKWNTNLKSLAETEDTGRYTGQKKSTEVESGSLYQEGILLAKRMKRKQSRSSVVGLQDNQMSLT